MNNTVSGDLLWLAANWAGDDVGASKEEVQLLLEAIKNERKEGRFFPEGF